FDGRLRSPPRKRRRGARRVGGQRCPGAIGSVQHVARRSPRPAATWGEKLPSELIAFGKYGSTRSKHKRREHLHVRRNPSWPIHCLLRPRTGRLNPVGPKRKPVRTRRRPQAQLTAVVSPVEKSNA